MSRSLKDRIIYMRMPWWCDCHEGGCHECATRYFNHKGYRCNSPIMITGWWWELLRRLEWWRREY
ncbi:MAG: hypothetical protein V3V41_05295 [Candidatus Heimdallarchaeota archaeon]